MVVFERVSTRKPVSLTELILHIVDMYGHEAVAPFNALLDLVLYILAIRRLLPNQDCSYGRTFQLLINPVENGMLAPLPDLFEQRRINVTSRMIALRDPGIPYLIDTPDVTLIVKTEKDESCQTTLP